MRGCVNVVAIMSSSDSRFALCARGFYCSMLDIDKKSAHARVCHVYGIHEC